MEITNTKLTYARASDSRCWLYICSFFLRWLWLVGVVVGRHIFSSFTYLRYIYIFSLYIVLKAVRAWEWRRRWLGWLLQQESEWLEWLCCSISWEREREILWNNIMSIQSKLEWISSSTLACLRPHLYCDYRLRCGWRDKSQWLFFCSLAQLMKVKCSDEISHVHMLTLLRARFVELIIWFPIFIPPKSKLSTLQVDTVFPVFQFLSHSPSSKLTRSPTVCGV